VLTLSLTLNVAVLIPVVFGLLRDTAWVARVYGPKQPARDILLAIYMAILLVSLALLVWPRPEAALGLLAVQVVYKLLSPLTVATLRNPVVLSNIGIAGVHIVTIASRLT
jgi:hypothetical protein